MKMYILSDETQFADLARGMRCELASEATGVTTMQFFGILVDIYGMEPVLRPLALVAHFYFT